MLTVNKKDLAVNAALRAQYDEICDMRFNANQRNNIMAKGLTGNAANAAEINPAAWAEVDAQTRGLMLPNGGVSVLLTDLMPLVKTVNVGVLASMYRKLGGEFEAQTSLDGQHKKPMNASAYEYDGALVLVHTSQFGIQWRELEGQRNIGFDRIGDDQANSVRAVRKKITNHFLNGSDIVYKGVGAAGIRNSGNVKGIDLGAGGLNIDFTSKSATYDDLRAGLVALVDSLHGKDNDAVGDIAIYVSSEVYANFMRTGATAGNLQTFAQVFADTIPGIAKIVRLPELSGNELVGVILQSEYIRPVVGMPVNTVPMDRKTPMDDYQFLTWSATGLEIRADMEGRTGVFYAAAK